MNKKISFCITCKNRIHQISETLKINLKDNLQLSDKVEFVLVDYESTDGLDAYIANTFAEELKTGYLKYFFSNRLINWHASKAKNIVHSLASGKILVNLDCDNYTGKDGAEFVLGIFERYGNDIVLHQSSGTPMDGSFGRIAMLKEMFEFVGGYDESFHPMGYQDVDLIQRLVACGLSYVPKPDRTYNMAIENSKAEGLAHANSTLTYNQMNRLNMLLSRKNLSHAKILVNKA